MDGVFATMLSGVKSRRAHRQIEAEQRKNNLVIDREISDMRALYKIQTSVHERISLEKAGYQTDETQVTADDIVTAAARVAANMDAYESIVTALHELHTTNAQKQLKSALPDTKRTHNVLVERLTTQLNELLITLSASKSQVINWMLTVSRRQYRHVSDKLAPLVVAGTDQTTVEEVRKLVINVYQRVQLARANGSAYKNKRSFLTVIGSGPVFNTDVEMEQFVTNATHARYLEIRNRRQQASTTATQAANNAENARLEAAATAAAIRIHNGQDSVSNANQELVELREMNRTPITAHELRTGEMPQTDAQRALTNARQHRKDSELKARRATLRAQYQGDVVWARDNPNRAVLCGGGPDGQALCTMLNQLRDSAQGVVDTLDNKHSLDPDSVPELAYDGVLRIDIATHISEYLAKTLSDSELRAHNTTVNVTNAANNQAILDTYNNTVRTRHDKMCTLTVEIPVLNDRAHALCNNIKTIVESTKAKLATIKKNPSVSPTTVAARTLEWATRLNELQQFESELATFIAHNDHLNAELTALATSEQTVLDRIIHHKSTIDRACDMLKTDPTVDQELANVAAEMCQALNLYKSQASKSLKHFHDPLHKTTTAHFTQRQTGFLTHIDTMVKTFQDMVAVFMADKDQERASTIAAELSRHHTYNTWVAESNRMAWVCNGPNVAETLCNRLATFDERVKDILVALNHAKSDDTVKLSTLDSVTIVEFQTLETEINAYIGTKFERVSKVRASEILTSLHNSYNLLVEVIESYPYSVPIPDEKKGQIEDVMKIVQLHITSTTTGIERADTAGKTEVTLSINVITFEKDIDIASLTTPGEKWAKYVITTEELNKVMKEHQDLMNALDKVRNLYTSVGNDVPEIVRATYNDLEAHMYYLKSSPDSLQSTFGDTSIISHLVLWYTGEVKPLVVKDAMKILVELEKLNTIRTIDIYKSKFSNTLNTDTETSYYWSKCRSLTVLVGTTSSDITTDIQAAIDDRTAANGGTPPPDTDVLIAKFSDHKTPVALKSLQESVVLSVDKAQRVPIEDVPALKKWFLGEIEPREHYLRTGKNATATLLTNNKTNILKITQETNKYKSQMMDTDSPDSSTPKKEYLLLDKHIVGPPLFEQLMIDIADVEQSVYGTSYAMLLTGITIENRLKRYKAAITAGVTDAKILQYATTLESVGVGLVPDKRYLVDLVEASSLAITVDGTDPLDAMVSALTEGGGGDDKWCRGKNDMCWNPKYPGVPGGPDVVCPEACPTEDKGGATEPHICMTGANPLNADTIINSGKSAFTPADVTNIKLCVDAFNDTLANAGLPDDSAGHMKMPGMMQCAKHTKLLKLLKKHGFRLLEDSTLQSLSDSGGGGGGGDKWCHDENNVCLNPKKPGVSAPPNTHCPDACPTEDKGGGGATKFCKFKNGRCVNMKTNEFDLDRKDCPTSCPITSDTFPKPEMPSGGGGSGGKDKKKTNPYHTCLITSASLDADVILNGQSFVDTDVAKVRKLVTEFNKLKDKGELPAVGDSGKYDIKCGTHSFLLKVLKKNNLKLLKDGTTTTVTSTKDEKKKPKGDVLHACDSGAVPLVQGTILTGHGFSDEVTMKITGLIGKFNEAKTNGKLPAPGRDASMLEQIVCTKHQKLLTLLKTNGYLLLVDGTLKALADSGKKPKTPVCNITIQALKDVNGLPDTATTNAVLATAIEKIATATDTTLCAGYIATVEEELKKYNGVLDVTTGAITITPVDDVPFWCKQPDGSCVNTKTNDAGTLEDCKDATACDETPPGMCENPLEYRNTAGTCGRCGIDTEPHLNKDGTLCTLDNDDRKKKKLKL
jgi:hypothetical protein